MTLSLQVIWSVTLMGAGDAADLAQRAAGWSRLERAVAQQHGPRPRRLGPRRACNTDWLVGFFF
jgi:hypothetical protein